MVSNDRRDEVISDPPWAAIEAAIRRLDNESRNDIYLQPLHSAEGSFLSVGGGAGQYVVTGADDEGRFPTLRNPAGSETELISLCVGGQLTEWPSSSVVDLESTLQAVRMFYEKGTFDCGIAWDYE